MIIVCGAARTGTSIVAGTLKALGIYMGESDNPMHEDSVLNGHSIPLGFQNIVNYRNIKYGKEWGFKNPFLHSYIRNVYHLLDSPKWVFCYRKATDLSELFFQTISIQGFWAKFFIERGINPLVIDFDLEQEERIEKLTGHLQLSPTQEHIKSAMDFYDKERGYYAIH